MAGMVIAYDLAASMDCLSFMAGTDMTSLRRESQAQRATTTTTNAAAAFRATIRHLFCQENKPRRP